MPFQGNEEAQELSELALKALYDAVVQLEVSLDPRTAKQRNFGGLRDTLHDFGAYLGKLATEFSAGAPKFGMDCTVANTPKLRLIHHVFKQAGKLDTEEMYEFAEFLRLFGEVFERRMREQVD